MNKALPGELIVRPVRQDDLSALAAIDMGYESTACYKVNKQQVNGQLQYTVTMEQLTQPYRIEYDAWDWTEAPGFLAHLKAGHVFGAFLNTPQGESGTGLLELCLREEQQAGEIVSLYVHRPLRGKGIGAALIRAGLAWAGQHDLRALLVTTQAVDAPAISFYRHMGFHICGLHDHYYHNDDLVTGEVAVFLVRTLP